MASKSTPSPDPSIAPDATYHELFNDLTLRRTSTFFRSMLSLPQGSQSPKHPSHAIPLDEEAWIVEASLRMACGLPIIIADVLDSFDAVEPVLHFCDKYGMWGPMSIIQSAITRPRLLEDPLRLYKLACRYGWPEAKMAGWLCLKYDIGHPEIILRLRGLDLSDYSCLMDLARRRRDKFEEFLNDPLRFQGSSPVYACSKCNVVVNDLSWRVLRLALLREIERCPSGDTIKSEKSRRWPETIAALGARHCGKLLYDAEETRANILTALDELPADVS